MADTSIRIAFYPGVLEDSLEDYHERMEEVFACKAYCQYMHIDREHMIIATQLIDKIKWPTGHNLIFTATADSKEKNREHVRRFKEETRVNLDRLMVPQYLIEGAEGLNRVFEQLRKNPELAIMLMKKQMKRYF